MYIALDVHVENGSSKRELITRHTHGLFHSENLGVIQGSLVEVLEGLGDEEKG